ncbi:2-amino-4-hydroxy-6-hydroxymethyldihydropteridine diphosphokinase [Algiphilus aromaticivorans]|uniref:2-amino-4-hydroxy-6- hydroxymethyldihydropteridine diphosphokinase n=1 Tax=Algiphilus aromaticivorans TaxID=382454 RepID=UPI0005C1F257|nr:2-amino-4-hydroxy-6-hydroxymethyldihydropteridine diphosphokinase [Algiphilus aromaticivorans]
MNTARTVAAIGLGANLGDPPAQIEAALAALAELPDSSLSARSRLYRSAPMGPPQPDYCNAACLLETRLSPEALLAACHRVEAEAGRQRSCTRWLARELDIDLLVYGDLLRDTAQLQLPHPGIGERNFVLVPLAEIAPDLEIPGLGRAGVLAAACGREGLAVWPELP